MNFFNLCKHLHELSANTSFIDASRDLQDKIFAVSLTELLDLIVQMGAIPEEIPHDSTEEKLFAKMGDLVLARFFQALGLECSVNSRRSDCSDLIATSRFHGYSLVADAKSFRLSRTAKNQKDFKVPSMVSWRGDHDFSVLVSPYYQYPRSQSAVFGQALQGRVTLLSWEHLAFLLENNVEETKERNLNKFWKISALLSEQTSVSEQNFCFFEQQDEMFLDYLGVSKRTFHHYLDHFRQYLFARGDQGIHYWEGEIDRVKNLSHQEAIDTLLSTMKISRKIKTIRRFLKLLEK